MHPYATDSNERTIIPFFLAGLAIVAAWATSALLRAANVTIPWWADAPSALAFYGVFHKLFEGTVWRFPVLHRLHVVKAPILDGIWKGRLTTSFDEHGTTHEVDVEIQQSWTRIRVALRGRDSKSHSLAATLLTEGTEGIVLSYQYRNEPLPAAVGTMQIHYGTARLTLATSDVLEGEYYSGRGRTNNGSIHLERRCFR